MFGRAKLVERRCSECGTAWLLSGVQARLSTRPPHLRMRGTGMSVGLAATQAPAQFGGGLDPMGDTDALLAVRDMLRACPNCQLQSFTDRRVTKAKPASPDASRATLP